MLNNAYIISFNIQNKPIKLRKLNLLILIHSKKGKNPCSAAASSWQAHPPLPITHSKMLTPHLYVLGFSRALLTHQLSLKSFLTVHSHKVSNSSKSHDTYGYLSYITNHVLPCNCHSVVALYSMADSNFSEDLCSIPLCLYFPIMSIATLC